MFWSTCELARCHRSVRCHGVDADWLQSLQRAVPNGPAGLPCLTGLHEQVLGKDSRAVPAGGACEIEIARHLMADSRKATGLEQYAIAKYAEALEVRPCSASSTTYCACQWCTVAQRIRHLAVLFRMFGGRPAVPKSCPLRPASCPVLQVVPRTIAETSGLPATEVIAQLHAAHADGQSRAGLDILTGQPKDLTQDSISDTLNTRWCACHSAVSCAPSATTHWAPKLSRSGSLIYSKPAACGLTAARCIPAPRIALTSALLGRANIQFQSDVPDILS